MKHPVLRVFLCLLLLGGAGVPTWAQDLVKAEELLQRGDYLFKAGYYYKASDAYRLALLEDPLSPQKKLAFGHALFAIGNYSYASYALRRGVAELEAQEKFEPELITLFPSKRSFTQALRDLKRFVTYSPKDPAGLSILGYCLFTVPEEEERCREMFAYLKRLNPRDPFAAFFLAQLERRKPPAPEAIPEAEALPPKKAASPSHPPLKDILPPPKRQREQLEEEWPTPVPAPAR